ncbi:MAG: glycosyltransferase family A protein [Candidatus Portnoybacteria bacterium]|jgi:glycosyltransferase involved in cell wall biosynthesis|nr:glycosyltransferase family A protein [Candidatus Portnoybacteria bacterium]
MPETAIIIRTKNEQKYLGAVLEALSSQTYKDFEIIIVDSGSTDRTLEIAKKYPAKIFTIPPRNFSYPYALNYGIERSSAAKYIVIISAHSIPISNTWLADGLENFYRYEKIMGIYGFLKPLPDASWRTWLVMEGINFWRRLIAGFKKRRFLVDGAGMGVMGFTNAIILKEL